MKPATMDTDVRTTGRARPSGIDHTPRPISGASMNPARSLGPDIVGNDYTGWWVYIAGPVIGAVIAVVIITAVRGVPDKQERDAAHCRLTVPRALGNGSRAAAHRAVMRDHRGSPLRG